MYRIWSISAAFFALAFNFNANGADLKIKLGHTVTPDYVPALFAQREQLFAKRGLDVEFVPIAITSRIPTELLANNVQIGTPSPPLVIQSALEGKQFIVVTGSNVTANNNNRAGLVAREGVSIASASDLVGKRIGAPGFNGTLHMLFKQWLIDAGVKPDTITFVEVPIPRQADALKEGTVDAVITADPSMSRIVNNGSGKIVETIPDLFTLDAKQRGTSSLFVASRDWAQANSASIDAFRSAMFEGAELIKSKPEAAVTFLASLKAPPTTLNLVRLPVVYGQSDTLDALQWWAETMQKQGIITQQFNAKALIEK